MTGFTKGPWKVRVREYAGRVLDCFVSANDVNGFPYDAEIMGDDEYGHIEGDIDRKLADAYLIAAAPDLYEALEKLMDKTKGIRGIDFESYCCDEIDTANKALAKARGET